MLAGDGMSQVTKNLLDLTQRRNFYAGDLLSSVEILRNVTETFKRASYEPSSDDVQVRGQELIHKNNLLAIYCAINLRYLIFGGVDISCFIEGDDVFLSV